ncbi:MAG: hypothetical protein Q7J34_13270 [Bacteroidales bacterium]|jgi:soluble P-type ATPase|nr:hypothetical protein [Bacteroidales bacterium]
MIIIDIPGFKKLLIEHLVIDFNGTIGCDGKLLPGLAERLNALAEQAEIHVISADTYGTVRQEVDDIDCRIVVVAPDNQDLIKAEYVINLNGEKVIAIGNGRNDKLMLRKAALGISVMQREGLAVEALMASDVLVNDLIDALDLLLYPGRLISTLRQ